MVQPLPTVECEKVHPVLRAYLQDKLSPSDRRAVARHLNLCASARKELEDLMLGVPKAPLFTDAVSPPTGRSGFLSRWFGPGASRSEPKTEEVKKRPFIPRSAAGLGRGRPFVPSKLVPLGGVFLLFAGLAVLTHFIQNPLSRKNVPLWLRHIGSAVERESPVAGMILDFRSLPHWEGNDAPVAREQGEVISDPDRLEVYWSFLKPSKERPEVDFSQNDLVVFFGGVKPTAGQSVRLKRMENRSDNTVIWYEERGSPVSRPVGAKAASPWVLQVIPKPPKPVVFKKAES